VLLKIGFLPKMIADGFEHLTFVETSSSNTDMCKFESSQREESRY